jgi:hypothetical protein
MRKRAFGHSDVLIVIAVGAVWIGISLPIYKVVVDRYAATVELHPVLFHFAAFGAVVLLPPALVILLASVEGWVQWLRSRRRSRDRE